MGSLRNIDFVVDDTSEDNHTDTGTHYAFQVVLKLSYFVPTGVEEIIAEPTDESIVKPIDV